MRLLPALLLVVVLAACGGSSKSTLYARAATKQCLEQRGVKTGGKLDFVASTATGGAFRAKIGDNRVTIAFGETEEDARQIELAYRRFRSKKVNINSILARKGNVVLLWGFAPAERDLETVADCLT